MITAVDSMQIPPIPRCPVICVAENRVSCEPGIRVLVASLAKHNPELVIELFYPVAPDRFVQWAKNYPNLRLNSYVLSGPWRAWNIKPEALLTLIRNGYTDVLWVDTDIIVTSDIGRLYTGIEMDTMIVAEEALCSSHYDGDALRARSWGLPVKRVLPFQLNGGVIGFTVLHAALLEHWRDVLNSDAYLEAQKLPWDQRPRHFMADQEVLTAMLCSEEFGGFPLRFLERGTEVIQYLGAHGYTVRERALNLLHGPPCFIHSQGHKAWMPQGKSSGFKQKLVSAYQDLSPYTVMARQHHMVLDSKDWLKPATRLGKFLTAVGRNSLSFTGLPIAIVNDMFRYIKWWHTGGEPRR